MRTDSHIALLAKPRTSILRRLIFETVKPGMTVLDAGTGSGILATWAAQAGAVRVVSVDREHPGVAIALARDNGVADRISHITADLTQSLPKGRFDVILGMLYENDPRRDEWLAQFIPSLISECLAPGGTAIPGQVEYTARLEDRPDQDYQSSEMQIRRQVEKLGDTLNLNLSSLTEWALQSPWFPMFPQKGWDGRITSAGRALCADLPVHTVDYLSQRGVVCSWPQRLTFHPISPGTATCVVWTQNLRTADRQLIFSNESVSWLSKAVHCSHGDELTVALDSSWFQKNILRVIS